MRALLALAIATIAWSGKANTLTAIGNKTACPGDTVTFTTTAAGPTPWQFIWQKNGAPISGQTTNHLTLTNVTSAATATYTVILKGGLNNATNSGTLTVNTNVSATPLASLSRFVGSVAIFSTTPSGTGPFTFTWRKNGTNISGQSGSSLTLSNLTAADTATYSVIVTGACGSPVTQSATLMVDTCFPTVDVMLVIDRSGSMSGKPYFDALAACSNFVQNLHYTNGDQAGLASYNSAATLDQTLTNSLSKLDQSIALVPAATGYTSISLGLQTGQNELASVRHKGQSLPVLVLLSDGLPTGSDNSSNVLYQAAQTKNAGTLVFTVGLGSVNAALMQGVATATNDYYFTTNSSQLTALFNAISTEICRPPTNIVVTGLSNLTVCAGSTANFSVTASGCGAFSYQWMKGGVTLSGKTNNVLTLNNVATTDAGVYSVAVLSSCQNVTNSATLTVNASTIVTTPPSNTTNCPGTIANFTVSATGNGLTYQWYKGTGVLSGNTTNTLALSNVSAADAGTYSVVVTGTCGSPVTNSATLVVNSNIVVTIPPANTTNCPGTTVNFNVAATGTGLTYQWYKGASPLGSQTSATLTLNNINATDAGIYNVVVNGTCGLPVTNSATLVVNSNVLVTVPPSNSTNCPGTTANFSVSATGTSLTFQWYKGTALLNGQTNSLLTLTNVSAGDAGLYNIVASGVCGLPVTNSATLAVNTNALITTPPSDSINCPGATANFSVNAIGTGLNYQWYKGTGLLGGQTNNTLTLTNVGATDASAYSVVVSGICGNPITNSATLIVNSNAVMTMPPSNATNCPGTTANFNVGADGTSLTFQWYKGATLLNGQTNSLLTLTNVSAVDAGVYSVIASGICGSPVTNSATLVVNTNAFVTVPPSNATNCPGTTANFSVNAIGTSLSYQWYKSTSLLIGQTNSTLTLTNVSFADAGAYSVVVSGICGSPITNSVTLFVNANVIVATPPANSTNCPGTPANFGVNASGAGLILQWYKDAALLNGRTNSLLTLANVSAVDAGVYSVVASGICGSPVTNSATLVVNTNALVATPPSNSTNCPGTTANFNMNAIGTSLSYQWYKGASLLAGQTNSSLTLTNVSVADGSVYSVVVSGICGTPVTNSAALVVNSNVVVATPPSNSTNCPGTTANFSVNATGRGLSYQWYKGVSLLSNQTNNTLTLNNVQAADASVYSVVVSGVCGAPITNSSTLVVNTNALVATPPSNSTNCPGTTANFSVDAIGTGLTYQWYKGSNLLASQTSNTLTLNSVSAPDAGTYSVVVTGTCGAPVTNSALLVVNQNVSVAALASVTNNIGTSVTFTAVASGTGPFTFQWFKGATALTGQTNSTLTLNNLQPSDTGMYSVSVTGACGQAATTAAVLTINLPPVVEITFPTNGTIFVEPATFTVLANASDPDGVVTNVEFFESTNGVDFVFIGETNSTPYLTIASNLPAGQYTFRARATDNLGAMGVSTPISVTVVPVEPPSVTVIGNLTLNTQDGYQWLSNVVCNPLYSHANALRVDIHNLTNSSIRVVNASGTNAGVPFIISAGAIQPGTCWTNVIKFYDPLQLAFHPILTVQLADPIGVGEPDGTPQAIFSGKFLRDGTFLVEFTTVPGITYYVQYSSDMVHWKTVFPPFAGTGQHLQWIDSGPPETESLPSINITRFYRVLLAN